MTKPRTQCEIPGRQRRIGRRMLAWGFALVGVFLLAAPTVRTGELNEIGTAKEQVEDASLVGRSVSLRRTTSLRRTALHGRREVLVFTSSIQARLGRERRSEPVRLDGHRLPNGLLAPMTC